MEVIPFGVLTFVVGALLIANAWAVVDAKMAVSAAAREATRAYVEAPSEGDADLMARAAATAAFAGGGRNATDLDLQQTEGTFARCQTVRWQATYHIPALVVPWVGGFGAGFTATASHAEVVDPYRTGVPGSGSGCVASP